MPTSLSWHWPTRRAKSAWDVRTWKIREARLEKQNARPSPGSGIFLPAPFYLRSALPRGPHVVLDRNDESPKNLLRLFFDDSILTAHSHSGIARMVLFQRAK